MKIKSLFLFLVCLFLASLIETNAQSSKQNFKPYPEIGVIGGVNLFWGDLQTYTFYEFNAYKNLIRPHGGAWGTWHFTPVVGLRGEVLYGQLAGENAAMNRSFEAEFLEANLSLMIDFTNLFKYNKNRFLTVYGALGIGASNYRSKLKNLSNGIILEKRGYKGTPKLVGSKLIGTLPVGLGLNARLTPNMRLNLEMSWHPVNTDRLDLHKDGFEYDIYSLTSLGLSYQFKGQAKAVPPSPKPEIPVVKEDKPESKQEYQPLIAPGQPQETETKKEAPVEIPVEVVEVEEESVEEKQPPEVVGEVPQTPSFYYSVQLIAKQEGILNIPMFRNKYNFTLEIVHHNHQGYNIYTTGQFATYNEARAVRDRIRSQNRISDAFVVAFKNGVRLNKLP